MPCNQATFRFYEELNDFLRADRYKTAFTYRFEGNPSIKDAIEAIGIPHVEVDLILVNGNSVGFSYRLKNNDFISVYPLFKTIDVSEISFLQKRFSESPKFILDVHLGKLAKYMRMLGFDTLYNNTNDDPEIIRTALAEQRIILTRDIGLLKVKTVTQGYWVRNQQPKTQLTEILNRFDLYSFIDPFNRCVKCNGTLEEVPKDLILDRLEPLTIKYFHDFYRCRDCGTIFWEGSHFDKMENFVRKIVEKKAI